MNEKKKYLSLYMLQHARIERLGGMLEAGTGNQAECLAGIRKANELRNEIERKIKEVDGGVLSELLFLKYVCGKPLLEISFILNYSVRHTERLHKKALEKLKL